ncbi:restriction endonuclease subunit S [Acinetobacter towneri]|uniref:restriction endonuclease subunit S n=1 Tax=Acinetobacter towneri TaxID=202956 RepID=UPI0029357D81|nr:restriction endonuclease subunit S [Acinetobacter towneri]MDV2456115.1 restriction endonuclease subunit S [Acinetobacter towneri]
MVKTAAKYQAYAEYKDSGVEWVGDIPSTWDVKPVLALFSSLVEKNTDGYESNVLSLSYGRIVRRDIEDNFGLLPESFNTYQIVKNGDIILRLTDLQNDKRSLRVGLVKEKGIITSAYLKLSANQHIDPRFAYRLLHSYDTTKVFYGMGGGLRQSMKFEDFKRLPILLPSKDEQTQIANFLDHETAKIDHLIEKQQQLIELLKEKRQAVISHAVTKGLDPNVPMKDSGVEWLGEVPEHWELKKLKYLGEAIIGLTYSPDDIVDEGEGTLVLRSSNVQNKKLVFNDNVYVNRDIPEKLRTKRNDILICARNGSRALIGKNALIDERAEGVSFGAFMSIFRSKYNNYLCTRQK